MYTFEDKTSEDKFRELIQQYKEFKEDDTSSLKATELCTNAWHLIDWVYNEFPEIHKNESLGDFRETLYPICESLKIIHDIANGSKHSKVSRPKAAIKKTDKHIGPFSNVFSRVFDQTYLEIEMEDGTKLYFIDIIESVMNFWKEYFKNKLEIEE